MEKKSIFSVDVEVDGLWGSPFAIAATVTSPEGVEVAKFVMKCDTDLLVKDEWVNANVIPEIRDVPRITNREPSGQYSHDFGLAVMDRRDMWKQFAEFYMENKEGCVVIAHCPFPVEARLFELLHNEGMIGDWDAPFPFIGIEGLLDAAGENPKEATPYALAKGLPLPEGNAHNPLFDCRLATTMYRHLKGW